VKRREGKPRRFTKTIKATLIHPSDASASTVLARGVREVWQPEVERATAIPPTTGAFLCGEFMLSLWGFSFYLGTSRKIIKAMENIADRTISNFLVKLNVF